MSDETIYAEIDWSDVDGELDQNQAEDVDSRKGLPSASEYPRIHACPGYLNLKRKLPKKPRGDPGPYAASGMKVHAACAAPESVELLDLDEQELKVFEWCMEQWKNLVAKFGPTGVFESIVEQRYFYRDKFSGQLDRAMIGTEIILSTDWKAGRIPVASAESNLQIRAYAVLLDRAFPGRKAVYASIIQPWVSKTPIIVGYERADLDKATEELDATLKRSEDPNAKRIPGPQCRYCPCRADCPEARFAAVELAEVKPAALTTPEQISAFLDRVPLAEQVIKAVKEEAKRRLTTGEEIPGYGLHPGRVIQEIIKADVVNHRASQHGVTMPAFMETVKIGKEKLKIALKAASGLKGQALDNLLQEVIDGCVNEKQSAAYLERISE